MQILPQESPIWLNFFSSVEQLQREETMLWQPKKPPIEYSIFIFTISLNKLHYFMPCYLERGKGDRERVLNKISFLRNATFANSRSKFYVSYFFHINHHVKEAETGNHASKTFVNTRFLTKRSSKFLWIEIRNRNLKASIVLWRKTTEKLKFLFGLELIS